MTCVKQLLATALICCFFSPWLTVKATPGVNRSPASDVDIPGYRPISSSTPCHAFDNELTSLLKLYKIKTGNDGLFKAIPNRLKNGGSLLSEEEKWFIEFFHFQAHCSLKAVDLDSGPFRISSDSLHQLLVDTLDSQRSAAGKKEIVFLYADFLLNKSKQLSTAFPFRTEQRAVQKSETKYIIADGILLTPGLKSMWTHCQKRFQWQNPGWKAVLLSGYQSPSFQFLKFVQSSKVLTNALATTFPPFHGGHHLHVPDIQVNLVPTKKTKTSPSWKKLYDSCKEFGLSPRYPGHANFSGELDFIGIKRLYKPIFANSLVPRGVARDLEAALYETGFLPSPRGLRILLALSAQESTIQWNPKLNSHKKQTLKKNFNRILLKLKSSFPGTVSSFLLSDQHKEELDLLIAELNRITDQENEKIREFDFYEWSRKTNRFLKDLVKTYNQAFKVGQWFFDVQAMRKQLEFEPQTFGLWQVNVNHLMEKMKSFSQLKRVFPQVYRNVGDDLQIDRDLLIKALSARPDSPISRKDTLKLVIYTHLQPRYENHHLGDSNDLTFYVAENMAGEMSTFRAAIQHELNKNMKSHLAIDGDLTYFHPYSTKIDWGKKSNTMKILEAFIAKHHYYFEKPVDVQALVRDLCEAGTWAGLKQLELYRKIIRSSPSIRRFPEIKSSLYEQTPLSYSRIVLRKSRLF